MFIGRKVIEEYVMEGSEFDVFWVVVIILYF